MYRPKLEQQKNVQAETRATEELLNDTGATEECTGRHWINRRMYRPTL